MSEAEQGKLIDQWVAERNRERGEISVPQLGIYPVTPDIYGGHINELVTADLIRHYADAMGDRNPLWRSQEYARGSIWGSIIAPPTFTDSITPFGGGRSTRDPEAGKKTQSKFKRFRGAGPRGSKRELFRVIRPGDTIRSIQRYWGVEEIEPPPGAGLGRYFYEGAERLLINQYDDIVAKIRGRSLVMINVQEQPDNGPWPRRKLSDEEREALERGYVEETRRGANILYWEDVVTGEELKPSTVGPYNPWDIAAFLGAYQGHAAGFDIEWERLSITKSPLHFDPDINAWICRGLHHLGDVGRRPRGWPQQLEGLIARMICNWMGDNGFVKEIDCRAPDEPSLWILLRQKGKVTKKYIEGDEYLVDLDVRSESGDGELLESGTATVRLPSRNGFKLK